MGIGHGIGRLVYTFRVGVFENIDWGFLKETEWACNTEYLCK